MAAVAATLGILSLWAVLRRLCASVPSAVLADVPLSSIPLLLPSWTHSVTCRLTIDQVTYKAMRGSGTRSSIFCASCGTTFPCLQTLISETLGSPSPRSCDGARLD
ncbi:hypothetical protein DFH08DRAFT_237888 [Mycena albidolilacea]|uniref:Secreted protein n=1 Tax=Mycena albidolilacea TaxID=1033008 RepID=A0AAD7EQI1_9AGAR|nr:hypothetical protein DFH08DRAFT_237888 [Mycena albidolilacea]